MEHPSASPQHSPRASISATPEQLLQMEQHMRHLERTIAQQNQQLQAQQAAAAAAHQSSGGSFLPKIRQPSLFSGTMGFAVDAWLSELQQQFSYYGARFTDDAAKIRFAVAYFAGAATHWWEHQPECASWNDFVSRLHHRFRPVQAAMIARQRLGKLRMRAGQSVNQYVGLFQNTLTPVLDMSDADQVHHFVNGLLPPIAAKVWEKHPTDLVQAIDAAVSVEAMHQFGRAAMPSSGSGYRQSTPSAPSSNPDAMDLNNLEDNRDDNSEDAPSESVPRDAAFNAVLSSLANMESRLNAFTSQSGPARHGNSTYGRRPRDRIAGLDAATIKKLQAEGKCFRCKEKGHMKNECPKKPKNE
jgi:hypothetical protein